MWQFLGYSNTDVTKTPFTYATNNSLITNLLQVHNPTTTPHDLESGNNNNNHQQLPDQSVETATRQSTVSKTRRRPLRVFFRRLAIMLLVVSVLVGLGAVVWYFLGWICLVQLVLVAIVAYLAAGNYKWFYVAFKTAPRDLV